MQFAQTNKKPGHLLIDWYLEEGGGVVTTKKEKSGDRHCCRHKNVTKIQHLTKCACEIEKLKQL